MAFTKEFALNLYPYQISALELCNCIYVQENLTLQSGGGAQANESATFQKCDQIYPITWPDAVLPLMRPTRRWIDSERQSVSVAGNPFQNHVGVDLGGGLSNKVATAVYDSNTKSCSLKGGAPSFGFVGRQIIGPTAESSATESYEETQELMRNRLEEIRRDMKEKGLEGEPIQDGCF